MVDSQTGSTSLPAAAPPTATPLHPPISEQWKPRRLDRAMTEGPITQCLLIGLAWVIFLLVLGIPIAFLLSRAFSRGFLFFGQSLFGDRDTLHAIFMTLTIAPLAVGLNTLFGINAAWLLARYRFRGRTLILTLIDLPFAVSPVVTGVCLVILCGSRSVLGQWMERLGLPFLNSTPSMVIATVFVTLPIIVRELIPVLEEIGPEQELAATSLGANGRNMFWKITLPNISLGLSYGVLLCNARAMGEFASVAVVSGRVVGVTETMPLRVELLFNENKSPQDFILATALALMALATLLVKVWLENRIRINKATDTPHGVDSRS